MKTRVYLDTSAYLSILLGEKDSELIQNKIKSKILCSSSILIIESERNLIRLSREKIISFNTYEKAMKKLKEDIDNFYLRDFTLDLCLTGIFPAVQTPRTMDLIHLRTALWFKDEEKIECFITLDQKLKKSAKELGFQV